MSHVEEVSTSCGEFDKATAAAASSADHAEEFVDAEEPHEADEGDGDASADDNFTEEEKQEMLATAIAAKERGNTFFKAGDVDQAIECYTEAIDSAPPGATELATFFANRAACYAKSGRHRWVAEDCTAALELQPDHVKALMRRAQAKETMEEPDAALADMKRVVELDPTVKAAAAAVPRLQAAADAKLEAQKEEMMGKLKDLGNTVLGKFGLSLDNFKADQDPNTGSYNISFQR